MKLHFNLEDLSQIAIGAFVLAVPISFSEEAWQLGESLPIFNLLLLFSLSFFSRVFYSPESFPGQYSLWLHGIFLSYFGGLFYRCHCGRIDIIFYRQVAAHGRSRGCLAPTDCYHHAGDINLTRFNGKKQNNGHPHQPRWLPNRVLY